MKNKIVKAIIIKAIKVFAYAIRWQLSTPVMSPVVVWAKYFGVLSSWKQVAIANLICWVPFYFIDKFILINLEEWLIKLYEWIEMFLKRKAYELQQIFKY
jgi:hypothetical protein